jgi:hypothetical protein
MLRPNIIFIAKNKEIIMENPNPISELINDEIFDLLNSRGLINEMSVRDYQIKKKFRNLREKKIRAGEAIEEIRKDYPYLQFDSIKKIVYK